MVAPEIAGHEDADIAGQKELVVSSSSAAAFVEGGVQEACDDSCSICLEPFSQSDPATITTCQHEYHLQCILEWAQRSKECPMCLRCLALKDPSSQELLETVEQEQVWSYVENGNQVQEAHDLEGLNALEERIMQHLAHQLARRGILRSGTAANAQRTGQPIGDENLPIYRRRGGVIVHNQSSSQRHPHLADRYHSELEPLQEDQARSPSSSDIAESLKSCILIASAKCKETFARTTRTFKERFQGRINKASDVAESANEPSTVARHVLRRVSPTSDGNEDLPST